MYEAAQDASSFKVMMQLSTQIHKSKSAESCFCQESKNC